MFLKVVSYLVRVTVEYLDDKSLVSENIKINKNINRNSNSLMFIFINAHKRVLFKKKSPCAQKSNQLIVRRKIVQN